MSPGITAASARNLRRVPIMPRKRRRSWKRPMVWTALMGATLALLFLGRMELRIAGSFTVFPEENADVRAAVEGIVEEIYVDEGSEVRVGDVIARLSNENLQSELLKTEAEIRETDAELKKLEAGATANEIAVAKAVEAKAGAQLKYARERLGRFLQLLEQNLLARNQFEDARQATITAENEVAEARARLNVLRGGTRPEEIEATRARIERLETQRRYIEDQLRRMNVVSPATGILATPSRQLKQMSRQHVKQGDLIAKVYDFETVTAQILISEKEIADVRLGQKVAMRTRAYPNQTFHGTVTSIATSAQGSSASPVQTPFDAVASGNTTAATKTVLVTTEIDNPSLLLKPEMTGQAKISCGQRRVFDLIMRRAARTLKVEFWSWW